MKKLRTAIIGCGAIFPMHAESVRQAAAKKAELVAVCDIKDGNRTKAELKYGVKGYADYRQMIDEVKPDVVHVCTPHYLHCEMAVYAARKGVHIFSEKPMAINIKQALEIREAVEKHGVRYGISFQNRYNPSTQLAKKVIDTGALGNLKSAKLVLTWCKPDEYYLRSDWKGTWDKEGGGVIIDQAIHSLDILRYVFNSEIDFISASLANRMHEKVQVEDEAAGVIMFKSGAYVNFYAMNHYSYDDDVLMEIHGEKGLVRIVKDNAEAVFFKGRKKIKAAPGKSEYIDYGEGAKDYWGYCHSIAIGKFYDAIINGANYELCEEEGLETQWMVEGIYEAGKKNGKVYMKNLKNALVKKG